MRNFIIAAMLAVSAMALGQGKGKLEMGFNTGLNMASVSDDYGRSDTRYGFNVGASADYFFSDSWSLKVKLIYDEKGMNDALIYNVDTGDFYETDYKLTYITIPVMANWHFAPKRNWYLNFGLYAGFLTAAEATRFNLDVKDSFSQTDAGLVFGIGVKIPINEKFRLFFEYEGQGGFNNISEYNPDADAYNTRSSINIGINFLAN